MYQVNATRSSYVNGWAMDDSKIITPETYAKDHGAILSYTKDATIASFLTIHNETKEVINNLHLFEEFLEARRYSYQTNLDEYTVSFAAPLATRSN